MNKRIAAKDDYLSLLEELGRSKALALDTETYGLREEDLLFSIIISSGELSVYFNFDDTPDFENNFPPEENILPRSAISDFETILSHPDIVWYLHNAKFDLHMLAKEGLEIEGKVICTMAQARVAHNTHRAYNLAACSNRIGISKSDIVEECISKNRLYEWIIVPGKKGKTKDKKFALVPFPIITEYGFIDAENTLEVGMASHNVIDGIVDKAQTEHGKNIKAVEENEINLTKVCFRMERRGIVVDREYVQKALEWELTQVENGKQAFEDISGIAYGNGGPKILSEAFSKLGEKIGISDKGNASFDKTTLGMSDSSIANVIKDIRNHEKNAGTYYSSFLHHADDNGILRASINQSGTETGRFSYWNPNLQNIPKEEDGSSDGHPFLVRRSFIPREDYCFVMIDYDQQEFRLMLDYAGEKEVIARINAGEDIHQATADIMGVKRKIAKTLNFGLLYGMGVRKLGEALGIKTKEAGELRDLYFKRFPGVQKLIRRVISTGAQRGHVINWKGRYCHLPMNDRRMAYVLPNHLIQGGAADVIKTAMVDIDKYLQDTHCLSQMVIQVHDEIVFEIHKSELGVVSTLKGVMESTYVPRSGLPLTCSVEHSWKSWGQNDRVEGEPNASLSL